MSFSPEQQRAWTMLDVGPLYVPKVEVGETIESVQAPSAPAHSRPEIQPKVPPNLLPIVPSRATIASGLDWNGLQQQVTLCKSCGLCESRKQTVFSGGKLGAQLLIIGEAPGEEEDRTGEPFVGQAGQLLTQMLKAIGLDRQVDTLILNSVKCRPPANRNPTTEELAACRPFLMAQIELARPKVVLLSGKIAALAVLGLDEPITNLRSHAHQLNLADGTVVPVLVSYHPAYYLRRLTEKAKAWPDLLKIRALL